MKDLIEHVLDFQERLTDEAVASVRGGSNTARLRSGLVEILIDKNQEHIILLTFHLGEPG